MALTSLDETRFLLNGLNIEPVKDGNLLVATDGRRLGVLFQPGEPIKQSFILPRWIMDFIPLKGAAKDLELELVSSKEIMIKGEQMPLMSIEPIEGDYPKWRQVVPSTPFAPANINLSALVLEPFIACAKVLCPQSPTLYFRQNGDEIGAISVFIGNPNFYGVIMPVREEGSTKQIPDWAKL